MEASLCSSSIMSLSGATIEYSGDTVCKFSSDQKLWERLNEQAIYMADYGRPFVEVLGIAHGRYWMRRYAPLHIIDLPSALRGAKESLEQLWDFENPRHIPVDWIKTHQARVRELCHMNDIQAVEQPLLTRFEEVLDVRHRLTICGATHGDATLSNVVMGNEVAMRWVDPIPPSLWLPAFKAVDLGKLLQSAHGWEYFLNNRPPPPNYGHVVIADESPADILAAGYFHSLCYLRILRYANERPAVYEYALNKLYDCIS
jgi:hypothetical protein